MNNFIKIIKILVTFFFLSFSINLKAEEKIKIGLLIPLSGENKEIGQQIIKAVRLAVKDINSDFIEIIPRDTASTASKTLRSAIELKNLGVQVVIGPVFFNSLTYLDEVKELTFLSLTNKTLDCQKI